MESNAATQITDLNLDCLEKIFRYLNNYQLVIIADCMNKRLKSAVDLVFTLRHGRKLFEISVLDYHSPSYNLFSFPNKLLTYNFQLAIKLLRCFGHLLTKFHAQIIYNADEVLVGHFVAYVKRYLRFEQLKEFQFRSQPNVLDDLLNSVAKPCSNAEYVGIVGGTSIKPHRLSSLFPKMQCLNVYIFHPADLDGITHNFPQIKQLQLHTDYQFNMIDSLHAKMDVVFSLNSHLNALSIPFQTYKIYPRINEMLPSLERLQLKLCFSNTGRLEFHTQQFDKVKQFKIAFNDFELNQTIPLRFPQLSELTLRSGFINVVSLREFLIRNSTVTKMTVCESSWRLRPDINRQITLLDLANILPALNEIALYDGIFSPQEILCLMKSSKTVQTIRAKMHLHSDYDYIRLNMNSKLWQISTIEAKYDHSRIHILLQRICL